MAKELSNLKHTTVNLKNGGEVIILDTGSVIDDLVALARSFESNAWIFTASFTIDGLRESGAVTIRLGGNGSSHKQPIH